MVKFTNVSQNYGTFKALHNLSFHIRKGALLALLGPNGAGKSTTMSIMTGFRPPIEGEVYINGIDIFQNPEKAKSFIGYLGEIPPLYPELTVWEYLVFTGELHNLDKNTSQERTNEVLSLLKIENRKDALIKNLSKGLKQRVGIAQSILHRPKLLVLDEPTVGLEPSQLIEFRALIRDLAQKEEMTVVISTHIMAEASELCDEVIIINEGRKIFEGSQESLLLKKDSSFEWEIRIARPNKALDDKILSMNDIQNLESKKDIILVKSSKDIAENLAKIIVESGAGLLSLTAKRSSLEDVFLSLTMNKE